MSIFSDLFKEQGKASQLNSKERLISEGKSLQHFYYVEKGCLRSYVLNDGREISFLFHFEGTLILPESLSVDKPALHTVEAIEPSEVYSISKEQFKELLKESKVLQKEIEQYKYQKLIHYRNLFFSRIADKPQKRYEHLLEKHAEIILRIPDQYIASFLGISAVSLSRIKTRINGKPK